MTEHRSPQPLFVAGDIDGFFGLATDNLIQFLRLCASTGRNDVTALPYGINTVSLFAFVFASPPATSRSPTKSCRSPPRSSRRAYTCTAWSHSHKVSCFSC